MTEAIREPVVSAAVSSVATNLAVRANLVARQQEIIASAERGIVAEGRDITTVVAPEAPRTGAAGRRSVGPGGPSPGRAGASG